MIDSKLKMMADNRMEITGKKSTNGRKNAGKITWSR